jgi:serine/threonine protein kinase
MLKELMQKFQKSQAAQLPGYAALCVIRHGGTSTIFKAKQQGTGRIVAVKVYKAGARKPTERPESATRDLTEGHILSSLNHPNVVQCLDHGLLADMLYVAMEYLEGTTLEMILAADGNRLSGHRLKIIRQGAAGLAHVHARRFMHRDFCPRNLFLTPAGAKLIDFSVAAPLSDSPVTVSRGGTAEIQAPEVLKREPADHRADIFSWGVVAYQVLSGHWPFEHADQHQVVTMILNVRPIPLKRRVPDLPSEVCEVVMRCLEKDPGKRPSGMNAVVGLLDRYRALPI